MCKGSNCECECSRQLTIDSLALRTQRMTDEGFLTAQVRLGRTGIQQYRAFELQDQTRKPDDIVLVYRPEEEVFSEDSIDSFDGKPVTNNHPPETVNIDNIKKYQIGHVSKKVVKVGDFLQTELTITDKDVIKLIQKGKVEVSNGYGATYDFTAGITEKGEKYDAIQRNIRGNHIAIVEAGRCGSECKILDSINGGDSLMTEKMKKMVRVDDESMIEVPEGAEYIVNELRAQIGKMKEQMVAKDKELFEAKERMKAQTDEYELSKKDSQASEKEHINKEIDEKINAIDTARNIIPNYDHQGKSTLDIKKEVIASAHSGITFDAKSDEYINARYDIIKEGLQKESSHEMSSFVSDSIQNVAPKMSARDQMIMRNENKWRNK